MTASKLVTPERPVIVPPRLAAEIGLNEAIILQQINYWLGKAKKSFEGVRWIWKTYQQWQVEFPFMKIWSIRKAISNLKRLSLIKVEKKSQGSWYQANWYTINQESLKALWLSICGKQQIDVSLNSTIDLLESDTSYQENTLALENSTDTPLTPQGEQEGGESISFQEEDNQPINPGFVEKESVDLSQASNSSPEGQSSAADVKKCKEPSIVEEVADFIGEKPSRKLTNLVQSSPVDVVRNAIAFVRHQQTIKQIESLPGYLYSAIERGSKLEPVKTYEEVPNEVYARRDRLVKAGHTAGVNWRGEAAEITVNFQSFTVAEFLAIPVDSFVLPSREIPAEARSAMEAFKAKMARMQAERLAKKEKYKETESRLEARRIIQEEGND